MINLNLLDLYRDTSLQVRAQFGSIGDKDTGRFHIPTRALQIVGRSDECLLVIASSGEGWDHVSASWSNRCPSWEEMEALKRLFFRPEETAMQIHVPIDEHINCHPYCLHLWRPHAVEIPRPPNYMVGAPTSETPA